MRFLRLAAVVALVVVVCASHGEAVPENEAAFERLRLRELKRATDVFYHAFDGYMKYAWPYDELNPRTCRGYNFRLTGGNMLTLIDSLDTLVVLGDVANFRIGVEKVLKGYSKFKFDLDQTVSVFETTIRVLGGLLSAHAVLVDSGELGATFSYPEYENGLLDLALDLGERLLPAFDTTTGIPFGAINLRRGVRRGETHEACTAGAGSLALEFGMLSVYTKDKRFGHAARRALHAVFDQRTGLDLMGRHLDVRFGTWTEPTAGIGSNIDSIYEYYLKTYELFGDDVSWDMFATLYGGAMTHLNGNGTSENAWYWEADARHGRLVRKQFSSLQAFWPGMQANLGDLSSATKSLNAFYDVWKSFDFLPEDFDVASWTPLRGRNHASWPLRPELVESTYLVHQATRDDSWLLAGGKVLDSLEKFTKTSCGFAAISDVSKRSMGDTMPSFFLAELSKYLILLFSHPESHFIRKDNFVFTTEAHFFRITPETQRIARELFVTNSQDSVVVDFPKAYESLGLSSLEFEFFSRNQCKADQEDKVASYDEGTLLRRHSVPRLGAAAAAVVDQEQCANE